MRETVITDTRIDTGVMTLNCLRAGDPDAPAVLLLHGGGLTGYTWAPLVGRLAATHHCVMPELRGHGDSDWAPDGRYTLRAYADDLAGLFDVLGLDPRLTVGMSLGGQVAMQMAVDGRPPRALALVDVGPSTEPRGGQEIQAFLRVNRYDSFEEAVTAAQRFNPQRSRESLQTSMRRNMVAEPDGGWRWKWDPERFASFEQRRAEAEALWPALGEIGCPVLIARGQRSIVFPESLATRTAAAFPRGRVVTIPGAGHTVQGDNPDALAGVLTQFIDEVSQQAVHTR